MAAVIQFNLQEDHDDTLGEWLLERKERLELSSCGYDLWQLLLPLETEREARESINFLLDYSKKISMIRGGRIYFEYAGVQLRSIRDEDNHMPVLTGAAGTDDEREEQQIWEDGNITEQLGDDLDASSVLDMHSTPMDGLSEVDELDELDSFDD